MGKGISEASATATMVQNWIGGAWVTPGNSYGAGSESGYRRSYCTCATVRQADVDLAVQTARKLSNPGAAHRFRAEHVFCSTTSSCWLNIGKSSPAW